MRAPRRRDSEVMARRIRPSGAGPDVVNGPRQRRSGWRGVRKIAPRHRPRKAIRRYSLGSIDAPTFTDAFIIARTGITRHPLGLRTHPVGVRRGLSGTFDTRRGRGLSSAGRRTRRAPVGAGRVRVPSGVECIDQPRGLMERIPRRPDEADLSAQEAPSRQGTRLPRPNEDDGRPPRPRRPAGPRSEAPVGLTSERGRHRPRLVMLSRPQDFAALQERGTMRSHPLLAARVLRTDLETTRFGLATGRALGSAVVRNRVGGASGRRSGRWRH